MAYPPLDKAWAYSAYDPGGSGGEPEAKIFAFRLIGAHLAAPAVPWICKGSSNSVAAGMDGVNRIASTANIVCADEATSDPRSWIVLEDAAGLQVLFHFHYYTASTVKVSISKAGFTGGSTTAGPTATDQSFLRTSTGSCYMSANLGGTNYATVMQSTDGKEMRVFITRSGGSANNYCQTWAFGELADAEATHTKPFFGMQDYINSSPCGLYDAHSFPYIASFLPGGNGVRCVFVAEWALNVHVESGPGEMGIGPAMDIPNQISGEWPMQAWYLVDDTSNTWLGRPKDLALVSSTNLTGTLYPLSGAKTHRQFGPFGVPWLDSLGATTVS